MEIIIPSMPLWVELISIAVCTGILIFFLWIVSASDLDPSRRNRLWFLFIVSLIAAMASSAIELLLRVAEMSGKTVLSSFPLVPTVMFKTHSGRVWLIRIACLVLMLAAGLMRKIRDSRLVLIVLFCLDTVIALTESASGHAADAGDFSLNEIVDWLHLFAALVWGGGLLVLSAAVLPLLAGGWAGGSRSIAGVAARFSRIAGIAVGTIALTALYNAWAYAGSIDALLKTPYGRTILAKFALLITLLILAAFNRYVRVPRLLELSNMPMRRRHVLGGLLAPLLAPFVRDAASDAEATARFTRSVQVEALLMVGVFFCAALLRHEVPAKHFLHLEHAGAMHADHGRLHHAVPGAEPMLHLATDPATIIAGTPSMLTVRIEDGNGKPFQGLTIHHERILHVVIIGEDLNVFEHIHPEDIGPVTASMVKEATFRLRYVFPKAGKYLIGFDFAGADGPYSKQVVLTVSGRPRMGRQKVDLSRSKNFGQYRVSLLTSPKGIKEGEEAALAYRIEMAGKPVTDLQPYLGAAMHLAVVRSDLTQFMHAHGVIPGEPQAQHDHIHDMTLEKFGPKIEAAVVFPAKGIYKIFSQVERRGKVLLFEFMVDVE
jgi:putative copper export protein